MPTTTAPAPSAPPGSPARSLQMAKYAHDALVGLVNGYPADKAVYQPSPTDNHLLWHLGHLAMTYEWFASALDGKPKGGLDSDNATFGSGSKPVGDAKKYPPLADLRKRFDAGWSRFLAAAESLGGPDATKAPLVDGGGFIKDRLDALDKCAWHDGWHGGQISGLRKALGLKPVWG